MCYQDCIENPFPKGLNTLDIQTLEKTAKLYRIAIYNAGEKPSIEILPLLLVILFNDRIGCGKLLTK